MCGKRCQLFQEHQVVFEANSKQAESDPSPSTQHDHSELRYESIYVTMKILRSLFAKIDISWQKAVILSFSVMFHILIYIYGKDYI